jgi:UDP-2,3-diacylglucosamine pyrophosphatase LpxH
MLPVVTAVISDLHLGTRTEADLLRRPEVREKLMTELEAVDHVVLLGDTIELRDRRPSEALEAAAPFFEDLGQALRGRRVTVVAGNHDYQLASPWLTRRRAAGARPGLGLEHVSVPEPGDPLAQLSRCMGETELVLAYPGLWLRADIYATHGHYLDCHNQVATFECLARRATETLIREPRNGYRTPDDYEAVLEPLYRAINRVAQSQRARVLARSLKAVVRWAEGMAGYRGPRRRPGLRAMAQVVESLTIDAGYVIFGHLHRPGPARADDLGWRTATGVQLVNCGSWVYEPAYLGATPADSPYWPGTCVVVADDGPPELRELLSGFTHEQLGVRRR